MQGENQWWFENICEALNIFCRFPTFFYFSVTIFYFFSFWVCSVTRVQLWSQMIFESNCRRRSINEKIWMNCTLTREEDNKGDNKCGLALVTFTYQILSHPTTHLSVISEKKFMLLQNFGRGHKFWPCRRSGPYGNECWGCYFKSPTCRN